MSLLIADKYVQEGGGNQADKIRPLLKMMQFIGAVSGGRSVTQVSLNYLISQGGTHHLFQQSEFNLVQDERLHIDCLSSVRQAMTLGV